MASPSSQITNFEDPFNYGSNLDPIYKDSGSPFGSDTVGGWFSRVFDSKGFQNWQDYQNKMYERESINSARAWDWFFDSTAVQRRVSDIEKAGLNPWLALSNNGGGINSSSNSSTASSGGNARASSNSSSKAAMLLAFAKIMSILLV